MTGKTVRAKLRKSLWGVTIGLGALFLAAQLLRVDRDNPPVESDLDAPAGVKEMVRRACYDCHSNETHWPWYSHVAPVSWLLARDVEEGRAELNYSTWDAYDAKQRAKKLKETVEEIDDGEMPPWYYELLHPEARLSRDERERLRRWAAEAIRKAR